MTAMDAQPVSSPPPSDSVSNSAPPPAPPPPPGCAGGILLPHWRSEPLPVHLAPTKEQIEKEQYAHLPDKLLNSLNKDKKPFTYTPSGVSGTEKGKLDLSSIRSPRMRKRLLANVADEEAEDSDQFEPERVTRSETPEKSKHKTVPDSRRAITPDMSNRGMSAFVLPPIEALKDRPVIQKFKSEEKLEAYVQKQMKEMENSLKNQKNDFSELEPEVQDLIDSYKNIQQNTEHTVPIQVEERPQEQLPQQRPVQIPVQIPMQIPVQRSEPEQRTITQSYEYTEPVSTKPVAVQQTVQQKMSYNSDYRNPLNVTTDENNGINNSRDNNSVHRNDSKRQNDFNKQTNNQNYVNSSNPWDSDLLRHVLDGGLQEEIEKFEQISLETQQSFSPKRNDYYERETTPTFETFGQSLPNPSPVWSPYSNSPYQDSYSSLNQSPSPYGSLNRNMNRNGNKSPQPFQNQQLSVQNSRQFWSESPSPSPHHYYERETASVEPPSVYRGSGANIPSNQYRKQNTGFMSSEVPNYNSRPKPFYLSSPPSTPTPPPPAQFMSQQQPIHRPKEQPFTTFGKNISPQKISYQNENSSAGMGSSPQTKYLENVGMYAQTTNADRWDRPTSPPQRSMDRNITFSERLVTTPDRTGFKSPEPPKPILKKKLPPSERPPDPTPPKYMGANIPSRSFRILQMMTGEDIDNQFIDNTVGFETKTAPKSKQFNKTVSYSNYEDFGTDF